MVKALCELILLTVKVLCAVFVYGILDAYFQRGHGWV